MSTRTRGISLSCQWRSFCIPEAKQWGHWLEYSDVCPWSWEILALLREIIAIRGSNPERCLIHKLPHFNRSLFVLWFRFIGASTWFRLLFLNMGVIWNSFKFDTLTFNQFGLDFVSSRWRRCETGTFYKWSSLSSSNTNIRGSCHFIDPFGNGAC